jgi:hypothetical protein
MKYFLFIVAAYFMALPLLYKEPGRNLPPQAYNENDGPVTYVRAIYQNWKESNSAAAAVLSSW